MGASKTIRFSQGSGADRLRLMSSDRRSGAAASPVPAAARAVLAAASRTGAPGAVPAPVLRAAPARGWAPSTTGVLQLVASGAIFGTVGVFIVEAGQPPMVAVWCRCALGALTLLLVSRGAVRAWPRSWRERLALIACGLLMTASWAGFFASLSQLSIGVATVVVHLQPLLVLAWVGLVWREPVAPRRWAAAAVALTGIALVALGGEVGTLAQAGASRAALLQGLGLALLSALCYAGVTLIARRTTATAGTLAFWQCAVGAVALAWVPLQHGLPAPGPAWVWLGGLGVLHTGLAYLLLFEGLRRVGTAQGAMLQFVYPVAAVGVDGLVYGHRLGPAQGLGLLLTVGALMLGSRWGVEAGAAAERAARGPGRGR